MKRGGEELQRKGQKNLHNILASLTHQEVISRLHARNFMHDLICSHLPNDCETLCTLCLLNHVQSSLHRPGRVLNPTCCKEVLHLETADGCDAPCNELGTNP